jgi:glutamate transport system permease protein
MTAVLYDNAGPKARARYRLIGVVGTAVVLAVLLFIVYRLIVTDQFTADKWEFIEYSAIQITILQGLLGTLGAFVVAAILSLLFGAVFAAGRMSDHRWLNGPSTAIVEFFRAIPLLVLMFILFFGVSKSLGINISAFWAVVLGLMLYNGSVFAEIFRAGVRALPRGQTEAAYGLGMRKTQVMVNVLLPQALRSMLPTIISQLVVVLKDTALGFIIGYFELLYVVRLIGGQIQLDRPIIQVGMVVAVIYIAMCAVLSWFANYLDKRTKRSAKVLPLDPAAVHDAEMEVVAASSHVGGAGAPGT